MIGRAVSIAHADREKGRVCWTRPFSLVALLLLAAAGAPALPGEVTRFLERREGCDHWTGEEPYDAERRAEIEAAIADLRCTTIERDEARLRKRHARRADVIAALDAGPVL